MSNSQLGTYTRPGIFINEINNSPITLPIQDVLINLVPGFSKKGPVNKPVYVDNPTNFESIFGTTDRRLENKGSFFHRTVEKMLQSGPVWALNLLTTDDSRDKLSWQTISVSSLFQNGTEQLAPYSRFFNRQDFWERDADAFMSIVQNPTADHNRLLHVTNMGDKTITTFFFKSSITGFDITAEDWYGGLTKVPPYVQPKSWISDYLITVLVLQGDWTDYNTLSVDTTWSKYFTNTGLIKTNIQNFVNERNVTVLGSYDVSLIPNFSDLDGRDMYIKSVINNDTDKSGLFVTYDEDALLGSDYPTNTIDILGETIADTDTSTINFLSYNTTISETLVYAEKFLDSAGNSLGLGIADTSSSPSINRNTAYYTNWTTKGISVTEQSTPSSTSSGITINSSNASYILNGTKYGYTGQTVYLSDLTISNSSLTYTRYDVVYLTTDNTTVSVLKGTQSGGTDATKPTFTPINENSIILGYVKFQHTISGYTTTWNGITVNTSTYVPFTDYTTTSVTGSTTATNYLQIVFGTGSTSYAALRSSKIFVELASKIELNESVIIDVIGNKKKYKITDPTIGTNYINLYFDPTVVSNPAILCSGSTILINYIDDEFVGQGTTVSSGVTTDSIAANSIVIAEYSTFYKNFVDGFINSNDYFYTGNVTGTTKVYIHPWLDTDGILTVTLSNDPDLVDGAIIDWTQYGTSGLTIYSHTGNLEQSVEIESLGTQTDMTKIVKIWVDKNRYSEMKKGMFLLAYYNETDYESGGQYYGAQPKKFTRIVSTQNDPYNTNWKILYSDAPIMIKNQKSSGTPDYYTLNYPSIDQYVTEYQGCAFAPFVISQDSIPNGTEVRQNSILELLNINMALSKGLANKNKISWRYLVDSFGLGLSSRSKQQYLDLCGLKLNCLAFISMPSAKDFKNSVSPSFIDDNYVLSTEYIAEGGNPDKNPEFLYSFGDGIGTSCAGYFFPYIKSYDSTLAQQVVVPPAAWAASTYMVKFITNQAGIQPWTIAAGISNGRVTDMAGTEMDFTDGDLTNLYQMGANAITYKAGNGYCINSECTAQVFPRSSLSYLHSREVLIELENQMYDMLLGYQWKFNTASVRAEIKFRADKICKDMMDQSALYDYRNVCDETNNTPYIIDLQMGVIDTAVEIIKSMGIIVNNITIMRTGSIASGGFA